MSSQFEEILSPPHSIQFQCFLKDPNNNLLDQRPWGQITISFFRLHHICRRQRAAIHLSVRRQWQLIHYDERAWRHIFRQPLLQIIPHLLRRKRSLLFSQLTRWRSSQRFLYRLHPRPPRIEVIQPCSSQIFVFLRPHLIPPSLKTLYHSPDSSCSPCFILVMRLHHYLIDLPPILFLDTPQPFLFRPFHIDLQQVDPLYGFLPYHVRQPSQSAISLLPFESPLQYLIGAHRQLSASCRASFPLIFQVPFDQ